MKIISENNDAFELLTPTAQWTENCFNGKCYPATRLVFPSEKPAIAAENQVDAAQ